MKLARRMIAGHWRKRPLSALLALLGVTLGSAVVVGVDSAVEACVGSFERGVGRLAGAASHRIVSPSGELADADYLAIRLAHPKADLTPMLDRPIAVVDAQGETIYGRLIGFDPLTYRHIEEIERVREDLDDSAFRRLYTEPATVMLLDRFAAELGAESTDRLRLDGGPGLVEASVIGTVGLDPATAAAAPRLVLADLATAQELTGTFERLDRIELRPIDDAELASITAALPDGLIMQSVGEASQRLREVTAAYRLNLSAFSLMASLVAAFLVYNATLISVQQRLGSIAVLRCLGASRCRLGAVFLIESAVIGVLGGLLGIVLGWALAAGLVGFVAETMSALYERVTPAAAEAPTIGSMAKGMVVAVASAIAGAAAPVVIASFTPPIGMTRASSVAGRSKWWAIAGVTTALILASASLWVRVASDSASAGFVVAALLGLAIAASGPALAWVVASIGSLTRGAGVAFAARLGAVSLRRDMGVAGAAAAATSLAIALNVALAGMVTSFRGTVLDWLDQRYDSDLYIASRLFDEQQIDTPLPTGTLEAVRARPDVAAVAAYRLEEVDLLGRRADLVATDIADLLERDVLPIVIGEAPSPGQLGEVAMVSRPFASSRRVGVGEAITIDGPVGLRAVTVAAVFDDYVTDTGLVMVDDAVFDQLFGSTSPDSLHVDLVDGIDPDSAAIVWGPELMDALEQPAGPPSVIVRSHAGIRTETARIFDQTFRITDVLALLAGGVALVGLAGATLVIALARRGEIAMLRAIGMTNQQLLARTIAESVLLAGVACGVGIVGGAVLAEVLANVIQQRSFGWTIDLRFDTFGWVFQALVALGAAVLAAIIPAWSIARRRISEDLRDG